MPKCISLSLHLTFIHLFLSQPFFSLLFYSPFPVLPSRFICLYLGHNHTGQDIKSALRHSSQIIHLSTTHFDWMHYVIYFYDTFPAIFLSFHSINFRRPPLDLSPLLIFTVTTKCIISEPERGADVHNRGRFVDKPPFMLFMHNTHTYTLWSVNTHHKSLH